MQKLNKTTITEMCWLCWLLICKGNKGKQNKTKWCNELIWREDYVGSWLLFYWREDCLFMVILLFENLKSILFIPVFCSFCISWCAFCNVAHKIFLWSWRKYKPGFSGLKYLYVHHAILVPLAIEWAMSLLSSHDLVHFSIR